jgi:hypothetical protein
MLPDLKSQPTAPMANNIASMLSATDTHIMIVRTHMSRISVRLDLSGRASRLTFRMCNRTTPNDTMSSQIIAPNTIVARMGRDMLPAQAANSSIIRLSDAYWGCGKAALNTLASCPGRAADVGSATSVPSSCHEPALGSPSTSPLLRVAWPIRSSARPDHDRAELESPANAPRVARPPPHSYLSMPRTIASSIYRRPHTPREHDGLTIRVRGLHHPTCHPASLFSTFLLVSSDSPVSSSLRLFVTS